MDITGEPQLFQEVYLYEGWLLELRNQCEYLS